MWLNFVRREDEVKRRYTGGLLPCVAALLSLRWARLHCLPLINRELQVAARLPSTYRLRLLIGGAAAAITLAHALFTQSFQATSGRFLFSGISWALFLFCILQGLRDSADAIASERREGTLGLLFLTDLRPLDVILGKLFGALLRSISALLAVIPAMMLPVFLGGVTGEDCWRIALGLLVTLLMVTSAGLCISAVSESPLFSILASIVTLLAFVGLLPALFFQGVKVPQWSAGPFMIIFSTLHRGSIPGPDPYWAAMFWSCLLSLGFLGLSSILVNRAASSDPVTTRETLWRRLSKPETRPDYSWIKAEVDDPATWLGQKCLPGRKVLWMAIAGFFGVSFLIGATFGASSVFANVGWLVVFGFVIKIWAAVLSVQPFHSARRSGALELLLTTPIGAQALVAGQVRALRSYFFAPVALVAFAFPFVFGIGCLFNRDTTFPDPMIQFLVALWWFCLCLLDLNASYYLGLWQGLTTAALPRAAGTVVMNVMIWPLITLIVPIAGIAGLFIWPWVWISISSSKLKLKLSQMAAKPLV